MANVYGMDGSAAPGVHRSSIAFRAWQKMSVCRCG